MPPDPPEEPARQIYEPLAIPLEKAEDPPFEAPSKVAANRPVGIQQAVRVDLSELPDVSVMRLLHDASHQRNAEEELRRRGFDSLRVELARRLTHRDVGMRKELVEALPQIAGVDARPWLEQLAVDPDVAVRRKAISILATDADESISAWLEKLRSEEPDAELAEYIDQLLRQR